MEIEIANMHYDNLVEVRITKSIFVLNYCIAIEITLY
jgi:hypothetical protein